MTGWFAALGLRTRLMIIGVSGLAGALAIGSAVLYGVLAYVADRTLDNQALASARDVATLVDQGRRLPDPIPASGAQVVQVLDARDRVVSASVNADRLTALLRPVEVDRALGGEHLTVPGWRAALDGPLRVVALPAGPADHRVSVVVAVPAGALLHSKDVLGLTLLATYPLLLAVLGLIAWHVMGRTLRPVEALRAGAERISGAGRDERLPVPRAADEIHALAVTLNEMLDRLATARVRQRAFVADAAHELRSPLASMRTQLEVAERLGERANGVVGDEGAARAASEEPTATEGTERLGERARAVVGDEGAARAASEEPTATEGTERLGERQATGGGTPARDLLADVKRLSGLVEDLLLLARTDDARPAARRETFDAYPLLEEVAGRYAGARVPVRVDSGPPAAVVSVRADRDDLARVLTNLVDNAVRHAHGSVRLAASTEGAQALITVTDDGPGVPEADRARVFERFTRLDAARDRDAGGSGLGLAIALELLRRSGGTVRLCPADLAGTDGSDGSAAPGLRAEIRLPR